MSEYVIKRLVPLRSPHELKEATVRDYSRNYARIGAPIEPLLIERLAVSDLQLVDAYRRGCDASPIYKSKKPKPQRAQKAAEADGEVKTYKRAISPRRASWLDMSGDKIDEKYTFMMGRLRRIADGASKKSDKMQALSTTERPDLAFRILRAISSYRLRHRQSRHNPFTTATGSVLSDHDAWRKFRRILEDICDDSSSTLGPWWVPK